VCVCVCVSMWLYASAATQTSFFSVWSLLIKFVMCCSMAGLSINWSSMTPPDLRKSIVIWKFDSAWHPDVDWVWTTILTGVSIRHVVPGHIESAMSASTTARVFWTTTTTCSWFFPPDSTAHEDESIIVTSNTEEQGDFSALFFVDCISIVCYFLYHHIVTALVHRHPLRYLPYCPSLTQELFFIARIDIYQAVIDHSLHDLAYAAHKRNGTVTAQIWFIFTSF